MYKIINHHIQRAAVVAAVLVVTVLSFGSGAQAQNDKQRIADLEEQVAELIERLDFITRDGSEVYFEAVNLHVEDGTGNTNCANGVCNGLGNLIVGYDEAPEGSEKTGSHNIVVGYGNTYTSCGGFVAGAYNEIRAPWTSVSGGKRNVASENHSSVSGGYGNEASGLYSSVSGGRQNLASEHHSSVSGGYANAATAWYSSVLGGDGNVASGKFSSVSGGIGNEASGEHGSVSGGQGNYAYGPVSSVSGGEDNYASDPYSSVSGGRTNRATGWYSSVSGGWDNEAGGGHSTVSGGVSNKANGYCSQVFGGFNQTADYQSYAPQ